MPATGNQEGKQSESRSPLCLSAITCVSRPPRLSLFIIDDQWALRPGERWAPPWRSCSVQHTHTHTHACSYTLHTLVRITPSHADLGEVCVFVMLWFWGKSGNWLCTSCIFYHFPFCHLPTLVLTLMKTSDCFCYVIFQLIPPFHLNHVSVSSSQIKCQLKLPFRHLMCLL